MSIYQTCAEGYDPATDAGIILECVSNAQQQALDQKVADISGGVDTFYLIFAGALVYFMQTGFAMLCAGSIRAKNVKNVILWNLLDSCGGGLAFWVCGYAFAYGGDDGGGKTFVGNAGFFLQGDDIRLENWFFQFAFACALSSIVAGTIAERTQMKAYLLYSVFLVGFAYPVIAHAYWSSNGWLSTTAADPLWGSGAIDLAGSGAVHMTGGVTALVAALILGPRLGRFHDRDGNLLDEPAEFPPHSVALQFLGTFCLWFGWYGFNPGSVLYISTAAYGQVASLVAVNTTLSACAGAVSAMFTSTLLDWWYTGVHTYDLSYTMNGCLTGLVAITSGCATVETWAAVLIGVVAGWVYIGASKLLIALRIDDAVDAIPVHMVGGAWGMIGTGLFTKGSLLQQAYGMDEHVGWFYEWGRGSGDFTLLGAQLVAILFVFGWIGVVMGTYFYFLNFMGWFRIDPLEEEVGMDISRHKGSAWAIDSPENQKVDELTGSRRQIFEDRSNSRHSKKHSLKKSTADGEVAGENPVETAPPADTDNNGGGDAEEEA